MVMRGALLWKRILNEGLYIPPDLIEPGKEDAYPESVIQRIITCPIIVDPTVQPLGDYEYVWSKYTSLAIPFQNFWVEGQLGEIARWGSKVTSIRMTEDFPATYRQHAGEGGWLVQLLYCNAGPGRPPHCVGKILIFVTAAGDLVDAAKDQITFVPLLSQTIRGNAAVMPAGYPQLTDDEVRNACASQAAQTVCDVLRLLACKNVTLQANEQEPKEARRAAKRHGGTPDSYRYHTLVVRPPGAKSDSPAQDIGIMPRHVCRGHFAEYGPEFNKGLLFGKYAGRFYVPPHLKGKKENGIVEKDYVIPAG
jgi:hypothetical protein